MIERGHVGATRRATDSEPEARPKARRSSPNEDLRRWQSALGNAAIARLLQPPRRTLARFGEPEHKAVGDAALEARWKLPGGKLFKELDLTFGDWIALGDWFEDVGELKRVMRARPDRDTVGQLYYAVLVKIRPTSEPERRKVEQQYMGVLFNKDDKAAVEARYALLKTRNIKHFPNPLVGDTALSTAEKAVRRRGGKPFGAIAQYRADHLDAIGLATSAGQLGEERLLGEALAMDGFACHYLTDAFSASHTRTPRSSIETYWDKKVPDFDGKLVKWLADEVTFAVDTRPSGLLEWIGSQLDAPAHAVRSAARKKVRPVVPPLSFGDVVGLVVHDWEGAHGKDSHGPLVEVAGQRFRTVGDERLLPAAAAFKKAKSESQLKGILKDKRRTDAERTFAGATLAVKASVGDVERAFELGRKRRKRSDVIKALMGRDGLFASERLIPKAVPDAQLPEDDRMPKWDYATVDALLADPKIRSALPESARKVAEPFEDTIRELDASKAVKEQLRLAVVKPLMSGNVPTIIGWLNSVIAYSPERLEARLRYHDRLRVDLVRLRQEVH
jgi:hypothetical protein